MQGAACSQLFDLRGMYVHNRRRVIEIKKNLINLNIRLNALLFLTKCTALISVPYYLVDTLEKRLGNGVPKYE